MNNQYDEIEEKAIKKLKPLKPRMKISGKSAFLLEKLGRKDSPLTEVQDENNEKISKKD